MRTGPKWMIAGAAVTGLWSAYELAVKPWMFSWGATPEERSRRWPGDELTPRTRGICTRAITIQAPPERIWPWIVQIGQDRAGFYSYTWLENFFRAEMCNTFRLVPEWQQRHVGDDVWLAAKHRYGGLARMTIAQLEPRRAMVTVAYADRDVMLSSQWAPHGSWNFLLDPKADGSTRLIMRSVFPERLTPADRLTSLFWDPAHFVMERKMMLTIKRLAESTPAAEAGAVEQSSAPPPARAKEPA